MSAIIGFLLGVIVGILACYAWQKGFLKEVGVQK